MRTSRNKRIIEHNVRVVLVIVVFEIIGACNGLIKIIFIMFFNQFPSVLLLK